MTVQTAITDPETAYGLMMADLAKGENERAAIRDGRPYWKPKSVGPKNRVTPAHVEDFRSRRREAVVAVLAAAGGWMTLAEIAAAINVLPDSARDSMVALVREGAASRRCGHVEGNTRLAEWRLGPPEGGIAEATARSLVLAHMRATPDRWATAEAVAREVGRATSTVKTAMGELEAAGLMERISGKTCKGGSKPSLWRAKQVQA